MRAPLRVEGPGLWGTPSPDEGWYGSRRCSSVRVPEEVSDRATAAHPAPGAPAGDLCGTFRPGFLSRGSVSVGFVPPTGTESTLTSLPSLTEDLELTDAAGAPRAGRELVTPSHLAAVLSLP
jgi:hypothetical protein